MTTQDIIQAYIKIRECSELNSIPSEVLDLMKEAALMYIKGDVIESSKIERVGIIQEINPESGEILHIHRKGYTNPHELRKIVQEHNRRLNESESFRTIYKAKCISVK